VCTLFYARTWILGGNSLFIKNIMQHSLETINWESSPLQFIRAFRSLSWKNTLEGQRRDKYVLEERGIFLGEKFVMHWYTVKVVGN
jgi:hypothetical protein